MIERLAPVAISSALRAGLGLAMAVLLASTFSGRARAQGTETIPWRPDFGGAMAEARSRSLPVWIQFTGPWCYHCRRMEAETLVDATVLDAARGRTIPVRLSADQHEALALGFGLTGLPATVILGPDGRLIEKHEGFADASTFRAFLDRTLGPFDRPGPPARSIASGSDRPSDSARHPAEGQEVVALGMAGYSPVALVKDHRLVAGRPELTARHDGFEYRFETVEAREEFLKQPGAFVPFDDGHCPVGLVDREAEQPGDPHFGVLFRGRLYLCADAASRQRFLKSPEAYANADVADSGFCPHCRARTGVLVRGLPEYSATHDGRRYLFPGPEHLEAFRASPERFVR